MALKGHLAWSQDLDQGFPGSATSPWVKVNVLAMSSLPNSYLPPSKNKKTLMRTRMTFKIMGTYQNTCLKRRKGLPVEFCHK